MRAVQVELDLQAELDALEQAAREAEAEWPPAVASLLADVPVGEAMHVRPLTYDQMDQLNRLTFCLDFAPFTKPEVKQRISDVLYVFNLHSYMGRLKNKYDKNNQHRGHCDRVRVFGNERRTGQLMLAEPSIARVHFDADGVPRGEGKSCGYRGYRSPPANKPVWKAKKPAKRKADGSEVLRQSLSAAGGNWAVKPKRIR